MIINKHALIGLKVEDVGKTLLERPKESLAKFTVVGKEELEGSAVSRVSLTSISGRTHQVNVHGAAYGHPIVGDKGISRLTLSVYLSPKLKCLSILLVR